jgi:hypothetical protein
VTPVREKRDAHTRVASMHMEDDMARMISRETATFVDTLITRCLDQQGEALTSATRLLLVQTIGEVIEHTARVAFVHTGDVLVNTGHVLIATANGARADVANAQIMRGSTLMQQGQMFQMVSRADVEHVVDRVINDGTQSRV